MFRTKAHEEKIINLDMAMSSAGIDRRDISQAVRMLIDQDGTNWVKVRLYVGKKMVGYETADMTKPYKEEMDVVRTNLERRFPKAFETGNWTITHD